MGRTLNALFCRRPSKKDTSKLKTLLGLAVSRFAILKNQRQIRYNQARSDLAHLLHLAHHDRALLRAELVIKEQNMLDAFAMLEGYCYLLTERAILLHRQKECPDELKEAIASLIYASWRSGDMPELQHVRQMFSGMFGREFLNAAIEVRNNCGVNSKIIQKLSTRLPSLEDRVRLTKEIAAEKGIILDLDYPSTPPAEFSKVESNSSHVVNQSQPIVSLSRDSSVRASRKYKDVASAAMAAFESAEDAAAAARAAVQLSQSSRLSSDDYNNRRKDDDRKQDHKGEVGTEKMTIHHDQSYSSGTEEEEAVPYYDENRDNSHKNKSMEGIESSPSAFSSDSIENSFNEEVDALRLGSVKRNGKDTLVVKKSNTETDKQSSLLVGRELDELTSDEGSSDNHEEASYLRRPLHHRRNTVSEYGGSSNCPSDLECDQMEPDSANKGTLSTSSYYSETKISQTNTVLQDSAANLPKQPSKAMKKAVSVRTRRGMQR